MNELFFVISDAFAAGLAHARAHHDIGRLASCKNLKPTQAGLEQVRVGIKETDDWPFPQVKDNIEFERHSGDGVWHIAKNQNDWIAVNGTMIRFNISVPDEVIPE